MCSSSSGVKCVRSGRQESTTDLKGEKADARQQPHYQKRVLCSPLNLSCVDLPLGKPGNVKRTYVDVRGEDARQAKQQCPGCTQYDTLRDTYFPGSRHIGMLMVHH